MSSLKIAKLKIENCYCRFQNNPRFLLKPARAIVAVFLITIFITQLFHPGPRNYARAAAFTFAQTSWTAGVSGGTAASPTSVTSTYSSVSDIVAGANLVLGPNPTGYTFSARRDVTANTNEGLVSPATRNAIAGIANIITNTSTGVMYYVYESMEISATVYNIAVRTSTDGGLTWGARRDISATSAYGATQPSIALDSTGNLYVAYISSELLGVNGSSLVLRTSTNGGLTWGARRDVSSNNLGNVRYPTSLVIDPSNNLYVITQTSEYNGYLNVALRTSTNGGLTWGTRRDVTTNDSIGGAYTHSPALGIDSTGVLYVVGHSKEFNASAYNIVLRTSTNSGLTWGARVDLTTNTVGVLDVPVIAIDSSNNLYVAYYSLEYDFSYANIALRTSTDGGATWGARRDVTTNAARQSYSPTIAIDSSNNLYVAYHSTEYNATYYNIALRASTDGGLTWGARTDVTANTTVNSYLPLLTRNASNNIIVAYQSVEYNGTNNFALRGSNLSSYGTRKDITTFALFNASAPKIVMNTSTGVMYVAYQSLEYNLNYTNIALRTSTDGGVTWGARRDVTANTTANSVEPSLAISPAGNLFVAYSSGEQNASYYYVELRTSTNGGLTWGTRRDVTTITSSGTLLPSLVVNSLGNPIIAYRSYAELGYWGTLSRASTNAGLTWGGAAELSTYNAASGYRNTVNSGPSLAIDSADNLYVAFQTTQYVNDMYSIAFRSSTNNGTSWNAATYIIPAGWAYSPSIAVGNSGNIYVTWWEYNGATFMNTSTNGGATWGANRAIADTGSGASSLTIPVIVDAAGNLYVVYYSKEYNGTYYNIALRTSTDGGLTWGGRKDLTTSTAVSQTSPSIALGATSTLVVVYDGKEYESGTSNIAARTADYRAFVSSGNLVSVPFDSTDSQNAVGQLGWQENATLPGGTSVTVSLRTAATSGGLSGASWNDFTNATAGCSKSGGTVTCTTMPAGINDGVSDQWFQYKVAMTGGAGTPTFVSTTVTYVVNAAPSVRVTAATQNSDGTVSFTYEIKDIDSETDTGSINQLIPSFQYCLAGATCYSLTSAALSAGATSTKTIVQSVTSSYNVTWTPTAESFANGIYDASAVIVARADDSQGANRYGYSTSSAFALDTKAPTGGYILVDASSSPATLTLSGYDDASVITVRYATSTGNLAAATYESFTKPTSTKTFLITDPSTVYAQFKDANSNESAAVSVTTPGTPNNSMVQDTSNLIVSPPAYRLFLSWRVVSSPPQGSFANYKVYRSTDQLAWTLLTTITDINLNYFTDTTVSGDVAYYYKIVSSDSLGNVSFSSNGLSDLSGLNGIANGIQDAGEGGGGSASAPTITSIATSSVDASNATITWDTAESELSNSTVGYSSTAGVFTNQVTVASYVDRASGIGQHSVMLSGLTPNTTYYFSVSSTNSSGNSGRQNNGGNGYAFTTTNGPLISPGPSISSVSNRTASIGWGTDSASDSTVFYSLSTSFASASSTNDSTQATSHSVSLSGLATSTKYYYYVRSVDGSSNVNTDKNVNSGVADYYSFYTSADVTAPTFSGFSATVATSGASIIWTTNESASSQIEYGTTTAYGSTTTPDSTLTIQHSASITGLSASTLYHYRALSNDANGNAGTSGDQTFTTIAQADIIPPVISNLTTSSVALTQGTVTWNTNEQTNGTVDFGTTNAYGSLMGSLYDFTSTTHTITLTSLLPNTMYYFRANSDDPAGNNASSTGSFVTVADTTPPVISATSTIVNDTAAFINWNTDELAYGYVNYGLAEGNLTNQVAVTSTTKTSHSLPITGLSILTPYYYQIVTADPSANTTTAATQSFTTLAAGFQNVTVTRIIDNTQPTDTRAPDISNLRVTAVSAFGATVTWDTDEESNSLVKYGRSANYGSLAGDEATYGSAHSVPLVNLLPGSTYHIKGVSFDKKGNLGASGDLTFTTLNIDGTVVAPAESAVASQEEQDRAKNEFIVDSMKGASAKLLASVLDAMVNNPAIKLLSDDAAIKSFSELVSQIGSAPTIVGIRPEVTVHGNAATVKWTTDKSTTGMVSFAREADYVAGASSPYTTTIVDGDTVSTVHTVELSGLESATRYHFQVTSKGEIGPEGRSADYTFVTEAVLPTVSEVQVVNINANDATIIWKTNVPTASSLEYTDEATQKTLTAGDPALLLAHTFLLQNLLPGTTYSLVIKAKNETGQESSSEIVNFKTRIDRESSVITNVAANSTLYPGAASKVQTIISWDTNEPTISQVFYQEGVADDVKVVSTTIESIYTQKHFVVLTAFRPGFVYKYWIEATDQSGNKSVSEKITTLTPIEKQTILDIIGTNFQSVFGWTKNVGL